jgi:hydroxymethylpyrimidine kinase/phosphomethylpyrimidine kinase
MTRTPVPTAPPVVCTIAGSDSGGGAGVQADLKTIEAGGGFGTSVVTAVTAQHTRGVERTHMIPLDDVAAQAAAVVDDFDVAAVKTGMLGTREVVEFATDRLATLDAPAVVDPVMVAASGDRLLEPAAEAAYADLTREATLVTPNADEAAVLTDIAVDDTDDAEAAATALVDMGAEAALVTGGHVPGDEVVDVLATAETVDRIAHPRVETEATHGSGCALSAAIATRLAHGEDLSAAVRGGIDHLARAVRYPLAVGQGPGTVHHAVDVRDRAAREPTAEAVADVVARFEERDVAPLVPEVGMNVVGATPYAEVASECAAVEGRITRTLDGARASRGVRFGASSHVARFLLATREFDADLRFAVNCRFDADVEAALAALDGPVTEYDRDAQPAAVEAPEGQTMGWGARQAFEAADGTPVAVVDRGAVGKEPIVKLLAADAEALAERTATVLAALPSDD